MSFDICVKSSSLVVMKDAEGMIKKEVKMIIVANNLIKIRGILFLSGLSFFNSVTVILSFCHHSKTLTLAITFEC
jgi:hypothetical protein